METILYVITDKKVRLPLIENMAGYELIQSGSNTEPDYGYLRVNTGDNISDLNWFYAELTPYYWIWKHIDCDIVGFIHYRRYLYYKEHLITIEEINGLLHRYDIIVRSKAAYGYTFSSWWIKSGHYMEDLDCLESAIHELSPKYIASYDYIVKQQTGGYHPDNIMICKKERLNEYCSWLFPILEHTRQHIDFSKFPDGPFKGKKLAAYFAEILLDVWIHYNNYHPLELVAKVFDRYEFDI